jgi:hypothetical protein
VYEHDTVLVDQVEHHTKLADAKSVEAVTTSSNLLQ